MKKKIINLSVTTFDDFSSLDIQRSGGKFNGRRVGSYSTSKLWPMDRQARRVMRMFRVLNAYTKRMMTGKV